MKTALLFSGQGSQYVGMMKDIADKYPSASEFIKKAEDVLGFSLSSICFEGPLEKLKETRYTQPGLFLHSSLLFHMLKDKLVFDSVAGHSVGEYAALYSAGVLNFEDALNLVALRGELMFQAGEYEPGTMFAVIGLEDDKVKEVARTLTGKGNGKVVVAANFNSPGQVVVSGSADYLRQNIGAFKQAGARLVTELIVSGAFHSPLMKPAKDKLKQAIDSVNFNDSKLPVYTNVYAKPELSSDKLKDALIRQLTSPVLWTQTLQEMYNNGIVRYLELGPGKVLQGLAKRTLKNIEIGGYDKVEDIAKL